MISVGIRPKKCKQVYWFDHKCVVIGRKCHWASPEKYVLHATAMNNRKKKYHNTGKYHIMPWYIIPRIHVSIL